MTHYQNPDVTGNEQPTKTTTIAPNTMRSGFEGVRTAWEMAALIESDRHMTRCLIADVLEFLDSTRGDLEAKRDPSPRLDKMGRHLDFVARDVAPSEIGTVASMAEAILNAAGIDLDHRWKSHADILRGMLPRPVTVLGAELTEYRGPGGEPVAVSVDGKIYVCASPEATAAVGGVQP